MNITLQGEELDLLPQKAIFWPSKSVLILSDLHLGKAGHFRKHGIPIPQEVHFDDLNKVTLLIEALAPSKIFFLGDLFHSDLNAEWWVFIDWIQQHRWIEFTLVKGNHDILPDELFTDANLRVVDELELAPFHFTHIQENHEHLYNLSGHIHPAVRLLGAGKQGVTLPCFHFAERHGLLPAFGNFTGTAVIKPRAKDSVYVIADNTVLDVSPN